MANGNNRSVPEDIGRGTALLAVIMAFCLVMVMLATCTAGGAPARAEEIGPLISPIVSPIHMQKPPEPAAAIVFMLDTPVTVREPAPAMTVSASQPQPQPPAAAYSAQDPERQISRLWQYILARFYGGAQ